MSRLGRKLSARRPFATQRFVPRNFTGERPGSMTDDGWAATVAYVSQAHGLVPVAVERVRRAEMPIAYLPANSRL